jgi:phosphatidylglycerophosphate synthase
MGSPQPAADPHPPPVRLRSRLPWAGWLLAQVVAATPVSLAFVVSSGAGMHALRYLGALAGILAVQQLSIVAMRRRTGPETSSPADYLTLARAALGSTLAALVAADFSDRLSLTGGLGWVGALVGVTALDWLDGPLARRLGPTRLGAVLDIEADSWLTLCCAAGAVAWGELPWWVLLPPLVRYIQPALALAPGGLPAGGGPWWGRVTGVAQMGLLLAALAPIVAPGRARVLTLAAVPVSAAQLVTLIAVLFMQDEPTGR